MLRTAPQDEVVIVQAFESSRLSSPRFSANQMRSAKKGQPSGRPFHSRLTDIADQAGLRDGFRIAHHRSYQVERSTFDKLLLDNAAAHGAEVREETGVAGVDFDDDAILQHDAFAREASICCFSIGTASNRPRQ